MIKVYAMNVSGIDSYDVNLRKRLSPKRLEKVNSCRVEKNRKQSIGAELLLNYAMRNEIKAECPVIWDTDENGKLFIPNCGFNVNLSHSGDYAACAVSDKAVGVDIQIIGKANMLLAKRFFTIDECEYINSSKNANEAFFDIWVKKESFIKAVGKGLAIPLSSFSVLGNTVSFNGVEYIFRKYSVKDTAYKLCACVSV